MSGHECADQSPQLLDLAEKCKQISIIDPATYTKLGIKRGLRDISGKGVVADLTKVSRVVGKIVGVQGSITPCDGDLYYRGYNVKDLAAGFYDEGRFGFEEIAYLLIFGSLPDQEELASFCTLFSEMREKLPENFVRDLISAANCKDIMNVLSRGVLTMYALDEAPDDITIPNVLRQCLQIIAALPEISVNGYRMYRRIYEGEDIAIHTPDSSLSFSENILHLFREDGQFTQNEARLLDLTLVLHMEHGGGTNSTFTTHVLSSSGTDTYSVFAACLGSLKGARHGGASSRVDAMMKDLMNQVKDWSNEEEITAYLSSILAREAFDHTGIIYGMGHPVYSLSDPRAQMLKSYAEELAGEKGMQDGYRLYCLVEKLAVKTITKTARIYKGVCANIDFYSAFIYNLLGLPSDLFTPLFAIARSIGWTAHRIEELAGGGKIIRPSYPSVCEFRDYLPLAKR